MKFRNYHVPILALLAATAMALNAPPPELLSKNASWRGKIRAYLPVSVAGTKGEPKLRYILVLPECDSCSLRHLDWKAIEKKYGDIDSQSEFALLAPWREGEKVPYPIPNSFQGRLVTYDKAKILTAGLFAFAPAIFEVNVIEDGLVSGVEL